MASALDLPPIFLLPTHLDADRLHELEEKITSLTYDIHEAEIILGNISKRERALFELRHWKVPTDPVDVAEIAELQTTPQKRKWDATLSNDESMASETGGGDGHGHEQRGPTSAKCGGEGTVKVVRLAWLTESLELGRVLPLHDHLIYEGRKKHEPCTGGTRKAREASEVLARAAAYSASQPRQSEASKHYSPGSHRTVPSLIRQTTSENDSFLKLPPVPSFLRTTYACQRATPANPPNEAFLEELKKIRTTRRLVGDQIGVRAYSTSIATISAYPHVIANMQEVARLPGCGTKIAELWHEWKAAGRLAEVDEAQTDPKLSVTRLFYDIWGVGDTTARDFYNKGWRDLDDVVEHGWDDLTRVQQVGVKFYDEFKLKIPRTEVESIAGIILQHARELSPGFQMIIVGGYRRGKQCSGDVDVMLSHPDEAATLGFVKNLVVSLEKSKHVTHTLTLSSHNSERGQRPLAWRGSAGRTSGSGFDTLDKALVVWQRPGGGQDDSDSGDRPHRRVDIIVSPWKTVGCAVLGWSGDTTFERDLRRYCKQKSLKFDSSGIRSRLDGCWKDFEGGEVGAAPDMLTAEKRVFRGLGLEFVRPEDRCTG